MSKRSEVVDCSARVDVPLVLRKSSVLESGWHREVSFSHEEEARRGRLQKKRYKSIGDNMRSSGVDCPGLVPHLP